MNKFLVGKLKLIIKVFIWIFFSEYVDDEGVRWTLEKNRPNISLLNFYNFTWKSRNNHFQRYTDVKPKGKSSHCMNK